MLVHFASSDDLVTCKAPSGGLPTDCPPKDHQKEFLNPFDPSATSRGRLESTSSTSSYLRPGAFQGHRDTLARLPDLPHHHHDSISESTELSSGSSAANDQVEDLYAFARREEVFARIYFQRKLVPLFPERVIERLLQFLSSKDYLHLRLTSRRWLQTLPDPNIHPIRRLPREILQLIYSSLEPHDFDSVRHVCREWLIASLDFGLLSSMLRESHSQGAWRTDLRRLRDSSAGRAPCARITIYTDTGEQVMSTRPAASGPGLSDEWILSKRLATEIKLSAKWHGRDVDAQHPQGDVRLQLAEYVTFAKILLGANLASTDSKTFTVSRCGRYLLTCSGHDIFVYRLFGASDTIVPVVRLAANENVLRVSMDTSSGRYDVGALLENRIGLLWEIGDEGATPPDESSYVTPISVSIHTASKASSTTELSQPPIAPLPERRRSIAITESTSPFAEEAVASPNLFQRPVTARSTSTASLHEVLFGRAVLHESPEAVDIGLEGYEKLPIHARPTSIFYDLGTQEDPPRSVAVCPQRKCLAFGCRTGIELHWVDALTGGDLNRWFPLAAPSDHLYFLPQRSQIDSIRKLRLISSARSPSRPSMMRRDSMPARLLHRQRTHDRNRRRSMTRLFFGNLPFPAATVLPRRQRSRRPDHGDDDDDGQRGVLRTVDCDHYQAVPIGDGDHILYTDPAGGQLCLGSDAPIGAPTKLNRKVLFKPPHGAAGGEWSDDVFCYTAATEARWGLRVISAHADGRVILYSIPSDVYCRLRRMRSTMDAWDESAGVIAQSDLLMDDALRAHPNSLTSPDFGNEAAQSISSSSMQAFEIEGVEVARLANETIDDIAVNADNGSLRLWIFCRSGFAQLLDLYVEPHRSIRSRLTSVDGALHDVEAPLLDDTSDDPVGESSGKGKERADDFGQKDWPSNEYLPMAGFDGTIEIDVDTPGGIWIDDTKATQRRLRCPAYPDCPVCGPALMVDGMDARIEIQVTGSGIDDRPLYAEILVLEDTREDQVEVIAV